jgi:heptosyltransferase-2
MSRILAIRFSALGDVVLATPALRALARSRPGDELHLVTDARAAPVVEGLPFLSRVWRWEPHSRHAGPDGLLRFAREIAAAGPFELGVDLQNKLRSRSLLALLGPARLVVLVKRQGLYEIVRAALGDGKIIDGPHATLLYHEPLRELGVVPDGGGPEVAISASAEAAAARLLGEPGAPIAALAPGARWAVKRWPAASFAEVGNALAAAGARIVLAGGPADAAALQQVRAGLREPPLGDTAGLDPAGLAAVLRRATLLVTCDSAPLHLAQAVGTPVVAVFGPTSQRRWGPLPGRGAVVHLGLPCSPCTNHGTTRCPLGHHDCMERLPAAKVAEVALASLQAGRALGGPAAAARARTEAGA